MAPKKGKGAAAAGGSKGGDDSAGKQKTANALKLRHILCEKQSKHLEALEKLKSGVAFDKVATEFSEDKARHGGSLGVMRRDQMMGAFQEKVFDIPVSSVGAPTYEVIKTKHGYHIVMVEARQ